jgi:hypothetical protein
MLTLRLSVCDVIPVAKPFKELLVLSAFMFGSPVFDFRRAPLLYCLGTFLFSARPADKCRDAA